MKVTIRQILSVLRKNDPVAIYDFDTEEYYGTVEECQNELPNCVLDNYVSTLRSWVMDSKIGFVIYKEVEE